MAVLGYNKSSDGFFKTFRHQMAQYKVRSGQNIYDVALSLYGSVEGIFDLLASNKWLNMETPLSYGMILNYHEEFVINQSISIWLKDNKVLVKNGEHIFYHLDVEKLIKNHIETTHPALYNSVLQMSSDEQNIYWETLYSPRMVIHHFGQVSNMVVCLKSDTHFIVDWGDYTAPIIVEGTKEQEVEHCYKGVGKHVITLYGDFEFFKLDFRELNGIYYPLSVIYADEFLSVLDNQDINKLIITQ